MTDTAKSPTILIVDDSPENLTLIGNLLKNKYQVRVASDGPNALRIATSGDAPDLILLDVMMPGMDGYEVCKRLKSNPETMDIPVIFISARTEVEDETKGLELGAIDYIIKPVSPPIVLARVKNHLALREKSIELERARAVAEKANLAKSDFLSSMSHELRSPLNAILGFAQLMGSDTPPPTASQKASIAHILQAGWHLLKLINEILDLAKVESGQIDMSEEPVSLAEVMLECKNMIEPLAQLRGIKLSLPIFESPRFVRADRTRLKQVLINLISNAIKYNSALGTITVSCTENSPGRIRISIKDSGAGLSAEQLTQLFQAFNRLGQEEGEEEGTGIGLVVAKRLVEMMGGTIGAESTVGEGSVFWFELLAADEPRLEMPARETAPMSGARAPIDSPAKTVLYVEDNPANMRLVEHILARHPHIRLLNAVNGNNGIEIARAVRPDAILMDINLPGISGLEALKILREDPTTMHIPVIAVSANAMPLAIERGLEAGFFRYVTKPIQIDTFMDALNVALESAQAVPEPTNPVTDFD
ncbi:MAG TPA: response regulator [Gallionella sp.]|nr:response regulator [Gallionella sp.]